MFAPVQPSTARYSLGQPITAQDSQILHWTAKYYLGQAITYQNSPGQPSLVQYSRAEPVIARTAQNSLVQPNTA